MVQNRVHSVDLVKGFQTSIYYLLAKFGVDLGSCSGAWGQAELEDPDGDRREWKRDRQAVPQDVGGGAAVRRIHK